MRTLEQRCWSDGKRHWFDAMINGYYMDEGVPGVFKDDGSKVEGTERLVSENADDFRSCIFALLVARPNDLI